MSIQINARYGLHGSDHNDPLLKGEDLSHTFGHDETILYLRLVLQRILMGQSVAIVSDVALKLAGREDASNTAVYRSPDISVIDGIATQDYYPFATYEINAVNPPPRIVFEIASDGTWLVDLEDKPLVYAQMGIPEYFTFDPNQVWTGQWRQQGRLLGWRLNSQTWQYERIPLESRHERSGLWSVQLDSFLIVEGDRQLRLYDAQGRLHLTEAEALGQALESERIEAATKLEQERRAMQARLEAERKRYEELMQLVEQLRPNPDSKPATGENK